MARIIPIPFTLIRQTLSREAIPFTDLSDTTLLVVIRVPGNDGWKVLRILISIPLFIAGSIVGKWMTFAPKWDSSIASS